MVPKGGLEPPRVSPPPPQDGVSASSTTSALVRCGFMSEKLAGIAAEETDVSKKNLSGLLRCFRLVFLCRRGRPCCVTGAGRGTTWSGTLTCRGGLFLFLLHLLLNLLDLLR